MVKLSLAVMVVRVVIGQTVKWEPCDLMHKNQYKLSNIKQVSLSCAV